MKSSTFEEVKPDNVFIIVWKITRKMNQLSKLSASVLVLVIDLAQFRDVLFFSPSLFTCLEKKKKSMKMHF